MSAFLGLAEQLKSAPNVAASWGVLQAELSKLGLPAAKYGFAPTPTNPSTPPSIIFLGGYGLTEFEHHYDREGYAAHDLTIQHCIQSTTPLSWGGVQAILETDETISEQTRHVHQTSFDVGLRNGVVIPLRDPLPLSRGGLTFQGDPYESPDSFDRFLGEKLPALQHMAEVFHTNLQRQYLVPEDQNLSARQKECLLWATYGLQTQQIADRLGTHPKTVEKQLAAARKKLRARTTAQAAVAAFILGLIQP